VYTFRSWLRILPRLGDFLDAYSSAKLSGDELTELPCSTTPRLLIAANYQPEATAFPEG